MAETQQTTCKVRDLLALDQPRTHELPGEDGRLVSYTFKPREHLPMPMAQAMMLVANDGFEVLDPAGKRLQVRTPGGQGGASKGIVLRPDEVVARLDELTLDALLQRATRLPGGDELKKNDGKDKVIAFMLSAGQDDGTDGRLGQLVSQD